MTSRVSMALRAVRLALDAAEAGEPTPRGFFGCTITEPEPGTEIAAPPEAEDRLAEAPPPPPLTQAEAMEMTRDAERAQGDRVLREMQNAIGDNRDDRRRQLVDAVEAERHLAAARAVTVAAYAGQVDADTAAYHDRVEKRRRTAVAAAAARNHRDLAYHERLERVADVAAGRAAAVQEAREAADRCVNESRQRVARDGVLQAEAARRRYVAATEQQQWSAMQMHK
jgi:hypothetical protein